MLSHAYWGCEGSALLWALDVLSPDLPSLPTPGPAANGTCAQLKPAFGPCVSIVQHVPISIAGALSGGLLVLSAGLRMGEEKGGGGGGELWQCHQVGRSMEPG